MENNGNTIAKVSLGISLVLLVLVIISFITRPSAESLQGNNDRDTSYSHHNNSNTGGLKICYFHADSVQNLDMMDQLEKLSAEAQSKFDLKMKQLQNEVNAFQQKWGDPSKLFPDEQMKYQEDAMRMQQEMAQKEQIAQMELAQGQEEIMFKLISRVSDISKKFAEENGYDFVLSYQLGQNIYYGAPKYDVTKELMEMINADYHAKSTIDSTNALN